MFEKFKSKRGFAPVKPISRMGACRTKLLQIVVAFVVAIGLTGSSSAQASGLSVVVNEVDCHGNDWIELYNRSADSVDISGWILTDKKFSTTNLVHLYNFPAGTVLESHARLVIQQTGLGNLQLPFGISCLKGGVVRLGQPLSPTSTTLVDEFVVPVVPPNVTYGRVGDGSSAKEFTLSTKNKSNKTALPVVIGARSKVCQKKKSCVVTLRAAQTTKFQLVKNVAGVLLTKTGKLTISANQVQTRTLQIKLSNDVGSRIISFRVTAR